MNQSEFWKVIWDGIFIKNYICIKKKWRLERAKCWAHWGLHQLDKGLEQLNKIKKTCQVACSETQSYKAQYKLIRSKLKEWGLRPTWTNLSPQLNALGAHQQNPLLKISTLKIKEMFYPIFKILKLKVLGWQVDDEEQRLHIDNGSDEMEKRDGRNGSHGCLKKNEYVV